MSCRGSGNGEFFPVSFFKGVGSLSLHRRSATRGAWDWCLRLSAVSRGERLKGKVLDSVSEPEEWGAVEAWERNQMDSL